MKRKTLAILSLSSLLFWQCGVQTDIAANYYDDGIYFDPTYGNLIAYEEEPYEEYVVDTLVGDYYDPNAYYEEYPASGNWYGGIGMNSMYSPYGWNSGYSMYLGYQWGDMGYGYGYPGYGYYPGYGMGGMYNPYCYPYGWGGYPGYGYGYPGYGYYPGNGGINDGNGFWQNAHSPNGVITGRSGPRGNRNNSGSSGGTGGNILPTKGGKASKPTSTSLNNQGVSKLRQSFTQQTRKKSLTSNTASKSTATKNYYQRTAQKSKPSKRTTTTITSKGKTYNEKGYSRTSGNALQRQTYRTVERNSPSRSSFRSSGSSSSRTLNTGTKGSSSGSRSYNSGSSRSSSGSSRATRSSSGSSRSKSSTKTNTTRSRR